MGSGNSALDISVEAGKVARSANLSQRRGQWVLRKFALGRPADQVVAAGWLPWWATATRLRVGRCCPATSRSSVCRSRTTSPASPTRCSPRGSATRLRAGRVVPRPAIERLDGDHVVFADGSRVPADLIVWATGYQVSFPFLDPALVAAKDNDLPLWKRTIHPDLPGLFFIGLVQPVGAVMPLAQAQAEWVAQLLRGRYPPPPDAEVRRQMRADHERNKRQFYSSVRHTMEVDFDHYLWDLRRELRRGFDRAKAAAREPDRIEPMASKAQKHPDMWVDPEDDPRERRLAATDERSVLLDYLQHFRLTFEMKCDGLDAEQLARARSSRRRCRCWGCCATSPRRADLVPDHDGERGRAAAVGQGRGARRRLRPGGGRRGRRRRGVGAGVARSRMPWRSSSAPTRSSRRHPRGPTIVRELLVHMIEEYARHCGHADLLRERIDGRTGQ